MNTHHGHAVALNRQAEHQHDVRDHEEDKVFFRSEVRPDLLPVPKKGSKSA